MIYDLWIFANGGGYLALYILNVIDIKLHRKLQRYNPIYVKRLKGYKPIFMCGALKLQSIIGLMIMAIREQDNVGADYLSR